MSGDTVFLAQYLRDRGVLQVRADAILTEVESNRTIVDAMVGDDAAVADQLDLLRIAAIADRAQLDILVRAVLNRCYTAAGLVIGSGDTKKIKIANTVTYLNGGLMKSKTTTEFAFAEVDVLAISSWRRYLITLQADGTPVATIGNDTTTNAPAALLPAVPAGETVIGELLITTSGAGTFVPNTDALSDAAVTDDFLDASWPANGVDSLAALGAHGIGAALGAIEEAALGSTGISAIGTMQPISS